VNNSNFTQLSQFESYAQKRFDLSLLASCFADARPQPGIPSRAVGLSLVLGEVVHIPSLLQLEAETKLPQWQRWVGYKGQISHDTFGYASERMDPAQLRRAAIWINRKLKRGKAFEDNKINGLLVLSLDASIRPRLNHRQLHPCTPAAVLLFGSGFREHCLCSISPWFLPDFSNSSTHSRPFSSFEHFVSRPRTDLGRPRECPTK